MYDYGEPQPLPEEIQNYKNYIEAQVANRRYVKRLRLFLLLALVGLSAYLFDKRPSFISVDNAFLALGITWLGFLPTIQYLLDRHRPPMPFFPLVGLFYATSFGLPMFASEQEASGIWSTTNVTSTALMLTLLGIAGMNLAFFISRSSLLKNVSPIQIPGPYSLGRLIDLVWILLFAHLAFLYIPAVRSIPSLGQLLDPIGYVAYGIFYILISRRKLPSIQTFLLLCVCVPLEIVPRFASGSLAQLMLLGLFLIIVIWYERKRIPVVFISITLVILIIFNGVKGEYRSLVWFGGKYSNLNPVEKVQLFLNLAVEYYQNPKTRAKDDSSLNSSTDSVVSRAAHIVLLSSVVKDTPAIVPYWNGETYLPLLTSYIPRALLPDKPVENTGNTFGRRYNYLGNSDFTTSFNLPWIVELYANFGNWGILIGMPLVGVFLAFLEQLFNQAKMNFLEFLIGSTVLFRLIYQESNFSLMTGSVITLSIALYFLFRICLKPKRRRTVKNPEFEQL
ncbi:MAG TPA: hypothetical protein V6D11_20560 [Waterburya sp.]